MDQIRQYGCKGKPPIKLRFSKSGSDFIEQSYATHFISPRLVEQRLQEKSVTMESENNCG